MQLYATSKDDYKVVHEISSLLSGSMDYVISDPFTRNDFEEELKNFKPSLEVEEAEQAIYNHELTDMTDVMQEMLQELKQQNR